MSNIARHSLRSSEHPLAKHVASCAAKFGPVPAMTAQHSLSLSRHTFSTTSLATIRPSSSDSFEYTKGDVYDAAKWEWKGQGFRHRAAASNQRYLRSRDARLVGLQGRSCIYALRVERGAPMARRPAGAFGPRASGVVLPFKESKILAHDTGMRVVYRRRRSISRQNCNDVSLHDRQQCKLR